MEPMRSEIDEINIIWNLWRENEATDLPTAYRLWEEATEEQRSEWEAAWRDERAAFERAVEEA